MTEELKRKKSQALQVLRDLMGVETGPADKLEVVRNLIVCLEGFEEVLEDMKIKQEPKYKIKGSITNRQSGNAIPDDEPIFILRARDISAVATLEKYRQEVEAAGSPTEHLQAVQLRVEQFRKWAQEHPDRMKVTDTQLTDAWRNL